VPAPWLVVIGKDDDFLDALLDELVRVRVPPLPGPTRVRRGRELELYEEPMRVLLSFDDEATGSLAEGGLLVHRVRYALEVPAPTALSVGPALSKSLRLVAYDLANELPLRVLIIVDGGNTPSLAVGEEVSRREP
jgi:hypothetical protein